MPARSLALALLIPALLPAAAAAQPRDPIQWVRGSTTDSAGPVISPDGRFVAYGATSLPVDAPFNAFVYDRESDTTFAVGVPMFTPDPIRDIRVFGFYDTGSGPGVLITTQARLLFDGDFVCMQPAEDCNDSTDAYRVPLDGSAPTRVSVRDDEQEGAFGGVVFGGGAAISADGRSIAFVGDRLVGGDMNPFYEVYLRSVGPGTTTWITRSVGGGASDGEIKNEVAISPNGAVVGFVSRASNLVAGDGNTTWDVFVYDAGTRVIERVSVRSDGTEVMQPSGDIGALGAQVALSWDGRYVAFMSAANDLVPGDMNTSYDIFVRDRRTGLTSLVTGGPGCGARTGSNFSPTISYDGLIVAFATFDPCFSDHPSGTQAAVVQRATRESATVSVPVGGAAPDGEIERVALAGFGERVVFDSTSTNLAMPGPGGTRSAYTTAPFRDRDGDGLLDAWEETGIDIDGDGSIELDLRALGATSDHKDIFVEIDYLVAAGHSHRPGEIALSDIFTSFDAAPIMNPDGVNGVRIHFEVDDAIPETAANASLNDFVSFDPIKAMYFGTAEDRLVPGLADSILAARRLVFRYVLMGHNRQGTTSSGRAELPGNDVIVSLGSFTDQVGTVDHQAGTIMHEFGHALGLRHGGGDDVNCKPNYLSIMSYAFQFPNLVPGRPLDYGTALPDLFEGGLDEPAGVGGPAGAFTVFGPRAALVAGGPVRLIRVAADMPIDWDLDGSATDVGVVRNVNGFGISGCMSAAGTAETLTAQDDWETIIYNFRRTPDFDDGAHSEHPDEEMTREIFDALLAIAPGDPNEPPVAVVGAPVTVDEGAEVELDGTGSSDPEGGSITHRWMQATGPAGMLAAADTATPTFTAPQVDEDTEIEVELAVHDGVLYSVAVWQRVTVIDRGGPPADGGPGADGGDGDGGLSDGGVSDGGGGGGGGGCGCRTAGDSGALLPLLGVLLALLVRRRSQ